MSEKKSRRSFLKTGISFVAGAAAGAAATYAVGVAQPSPSVGQTSTTTVMQSPTDWEQWMLSRSDMTKQLRVDLGGGSYQDSWVSNCVNPFQAKYGIQVTVGTLDYGAMISSVKTSPPGTFDVMFAQDNDLADMIGAGLIEPLDFTALPNLANVEKGWQNPPYNPGSVLHCTPHDGSMGNITWRTDLATQLNSLTEEEMSLEVLRDPKYPWVKNKSMGMSDWPFAHIVDSIIALGIDVNDTKKVGDSEDEIFGYLGEIMKNMRVIGGGQDLVQNATNGNIQVVWQQVSGRFVKAANQGVPVKTVSPKEGSWWNVLGTGIIKGSTNKLAAELFINFTEDKGVNNAVFSEVPYQPVIDWGDFPVSDAIKNGPESDYNNPYRRSLRKTINAENYLWYDSRTPDWTTRFDQLKGS